MTTLGGEYRDSDPRRDFTIYDARKRLLSAVERLAPDVLKALLHEVLPVYTDVLGKTTPPSVTRRPRGPFGQEVTVQSEPEWVWWRWENSEWDSLDERWAVLLPLREELNGWADEHCHIQDRWFLDVAMRTLHNRHKLERRRDALEYEFDHLRQSFPTKEGQIRKLYEARLELVQKRIEKSATVFASPYFMDAEIRVPFSFEHDPWFPRWQARREYEREVRDAFEVKLDEYCSALEAEARKDGLRPAPTKRTRISNVPDVHFEWLVRHRVQGQTYKEIAQEYGVDVKTIAAGCRNVADLIGLKRLPGRRSVKRT